MAVQPVRLLLVDTLARLRGAHLQRAQQLQANVGTSSTPALKRHLRDLAKADARHARDIERMLGTLHADATAQPDRAMAGLIDANNGLIARCDARIARDLANIASTQAAAQVLIAQYRAAHAYAATLGLGRMPGTLKRAQRDLASSDLALSRLATRLLKASSRTNRARADGGPAMATIVGTLAVGLLGFTLLTPPKPRRRGFAALLAKRR